MGEKSMGTVIDDQGFRYLWQDKSRSQVGALFTAVGGMRFIPGCDRALFDAAQSELHRYKADSLRWQRGEVQDIEPADREVLAKGWADWLVACQVQDAGWVDCRSARLPLPTGYVLAFSASQEGVIATVIDERNPKRQSVAGKYLVTDTGCWVGRDFSIQKPSPQAALTHIIDGQARFESTRDWAAKALGVPA
jgi:hypothetical protein